MNAKTWQSIAGLSYGLVFLFLAAFLTPPDHPLADGLQTTFYIALVLVVLMSAVVGILLALRRLRLGCPFCWTPSPVVGLGKRDIYLKCPSCGSVCVTSRPFRTATAAKLDGSSQ